MFPLAGIAAGLAARVAAPMLGRVVGAQFAKVAARPAAAMLSKTVGRTVPAQVAGKFIGTKAPGAISLGVTQYGNAQLFNAAMNSGRNNQQENSEFIA
jgi:hypothetical protein